MTQSNPFGDTDTNEAFQALFGSFTKDTKVVADKEYRCVKCKYPMTVIEVKLSTLSIDPTRKLFFCKKNTCIHFGLITVVAAK